MLLTNQFTLFVSVIATHYTHSNAITTFVVLIRKLFKAKTDNATPGVATQNGYNFLSPTRQFSLMLWQSNFCHDVILLRVPSPTSLAVAGGGNSDKSAKKLPFWTYAPFQ